MNNSVRTVSDSCTLSAEITVQFNALLPDSTSEGFYPQTSQSPPSRAVLPRTLRLGGSVAPPRTPSLPPSLPPPSLPNFFRRRLPAARTIKHGEPIEIRPNLQGVTCETVDVITERLFSERYLSSGWMLMSLWL